MQIKIIYVKIIECWNYDEKDDFVDLKCKINCWENFLMEFKASIIQSFNENKKKWNVF